MRTKAIRDLAQLSAPDFFSEISVGLEHILNNAIRLEQGRNILAEHKHPHGHRVLLGIAEEEAAKFHILVDAVRCPLVPRKQFTQQLGRFCNHLAKGIYAEACCWRPDTFGRLTEYVGREREEFYLDGPNDVDWIFRNRILQSREETIYVDYAETDEGHLWLTPPTSDSDLLFSHTPATLRLAQALRDSGCITPEALALIAKLWRPVEMTADFHWADLRKLNSQTLEELDADSLLREQPQEVYSTIVQDWPFPMYSLDLSLASVDRAVLKEIQER